MSEYVSVSRADKREAGSCSACPQDASRIVNVIRLGKYHKTEVRLCDSCLAETNKAQIRAKRQPRLPG